MHRAGETGSSALPRAGQRSAQGQRSGIRINPDVALFMLEDSGVFFTGQDLQSFNTAATYVWCCLEEGQAPRGIAAGYAHAFGIPVAEAAGHVAGLLHRWQGVGYLSGVDTPAPRDIDFATALGRLLANPELRREFARDAQMTLGRLSVAASDRAALLSLDPAALERQAQMLQAKIAAFRPRFRPRHNAANASAISRLQRPTPRPDATLTARYYRLLDTTFRLECDSAVVFEQLRPVLASVEVDPSPAVDSVLTVLEQAPGYILQEDSRPFASCPPEQIVPQAVSALRDIALDACDCLLRVHGAVLAVDGPSVLLPTVTASESTLLSAALIPSGFSFIADGVVPLTPHRLEPRPVHGALVIAANAMGALADYYPELTLLPTYRDEHGGAIGVLPLPRDAWPRADGAEHGVRRVIFPRRVPGGETTLQPVPRPEALQRLLQKHAVVTRPLAKNDAAELVEWVRGVDCYDLSFGSLADAAQTIESLCR